MVMVPMNQAMNMMMPHPMKQKKETKLSIGAAEFVPKSVKEAQQKEQKKLEAPQKKQNPLGVWPNLEGLDINGQDPRQRYIKQCDCIKFRWVNLKGRNNANPNMELAAIRAKVLTMAQDFLNPTVTPALPHTPLTPVG